MSEHLPTGAQQLHRHPTVAQVLESTVQPDPTKSVPFERFAALKDSEDMLVRAAFWAFYAAWQAESLSTELHGTGHVTLAVEARADAHMLHTISHQLLLRDAVLVQRSYIEHLEVYPRPPYLVTYGALFWSICFCLVMGIGIGLAIHGIQ